MNFGPKPTNKHAIAWSKQFWPITHRLLTFWPRFLLLLFPTTESHQVGFFSCSVTPFAPTRAPVGSLFPKWGCDFRPCRTATCRPRHPSSSSPVTLQKIPVHLCKAAKHLCLLPCGPCRSSFPCSLQLLHNMTCFLFSTQTTTLQAAAKHRPMQPWNPQATCSPTCLLTISI